MVIKSFVSKEQYLNFLYPGKITNMQKIYENILVKPFIKENEYFEERNIIKQQMLTRIENKMTLDEYKSWISIIKKIGNDEFPIAIDDLVKIFTTSDEELIKITSKELTLNDYNFINVCNLKTNDKIDNSKIKPYHLIHILTEIISSTKSFIINYAIKTTRENGNTSSSCIEILNDLKKDDSFYYQTLKEMFISKFSYLENSMFKDIYQYMLITLRTEYRKCITSKCQEHAIFEDYHKNHVRKIKKFK